ncbi:Carboxylic acid transporter protein [Wickerhamomyces ciferrii]|uniref:Carboxylic acid transporter protein n=1 Tax=Wickerhamomyces ciferrii (strain ATCC 14091 / BCRC 22168 / CBS 111 / JCM 3599 / NBRC 0793 / NRRL Y-1031 F-60-10) TaxID=1206466 RepID=K0KQE1_WICCF|nr:Carboxylic acid transporter protein [Wickerhamomyces ciferrii]CCH43458.1 Carboxylic acid transporter protein [Wickerhamomyces ciferrii]
MSKLATVKEYFITRFTTLVPSREEFEAEKEALNPFPALKQMNKRQWQFFLVGFCAWTWDAFDFFAVSLNAAAIAESLGKNVSDVTWGITLVLMLRSVGAVLFGYLGDRYGRKLPYCLNMGLLVVLQIACGFVKTYEAFLGVRALFGIVLGGCFGVAAATSLEGVPVRARSVLSGVFQQGYALGYLLVVVFNRAITDNSPHGWRAIFWFSAGPPVLLLAWRLCLPETDEFLQQQLHLQEGQKAQFFKDAKKALKQHWLKLIYMVILMSGFNFSSHGSQDLYPTLLTKQRGFGHDRSTVTNSVANLGAIAGGILMGHFSGFVGRRLIVVIGCICGGAMIYPWAFVKGVGGTNAGAFWLQFFVQGNWAIVPIHLTELSPPEFKAFVTGVSYQLGNLASSASSTIESTIGERFPLYDEAGNQRDGVYDYGKVMAIFMGCVFAFLLVVTLLGPENRNGNINYQLSDEEIKDLAEQGKIVNTSEHHEYAEGGSSSGNEGTGEKDKALIVHKE